MIKILSLISSASVKLMCFVPEAMINLEAIIDELNHQEQDILSLQEVDATRHGSAHRDGVMQTANSYVLTGHVNVTSASVQCICSRTENSLDQSPHHSLGLDVVQIISLLKIKYMLIQPTA